MTRPGRPRNFAALAEVANGLARGESLAAIATRTGMSRDRVRWYARSLRGAGAGVISTPGGNGGVAEIPPRTRAGATPRTQRAFPNAPPTRTTESTRARTRASARAALEPASERADARPASTAQVYVGVHDRRFRMDCLTLPLKFPRFAWDKLANGTTAAIAKGTETRYYTPRPGLVVVWSTGAFKSSVQARVTVRPDRSLPRAAQALDVERRALRVAEDVRTQMERELACSLSAPRAIGVPKHSVLGSHAAKRLRDAGIARAPDGPEGWGADDTPVPGTAELARAEDVEPFMRGDAFESDPIAKGRELDAIGQRLAAIERQTAQNNALGTAAIDSLASLSPLVREALIRLNTMERADQVATLRAERGGAWGTGRAA